MTIKFLNLIILPAILLAMLGGCAELGSIQLIDNHTDVPQRKAIIFFVDGMDHAIFHQMLEQGRLPDIDKYLVRRGCRIEKAVTAIPSITYAINATFATGMLPGHHGILGNKFFDRDRLVYIDYNSIATYRNIDNDYYLPNIYEILGDTFSVTIQTPLARGAYHRIDNWATSGTLWFFRRYKSVDRWIPRQFHIIANIAINSGHWPGLIFCYFPATDEIGHRYGTHHRRYTHSIANVDRQIGHICRALEQNGLLEDTYLILISDHGMDNRQSDNYLDIKGLLENKFHWRITEKGPDHRKKFQERAHYFQKFDAILGNGGGRRANLYIQNGDNWKTLADEEQIITVADFLARHDGAGVIAYRFKQGIIVQNHAGKALIERNGNPASNLDQKEYRYRVIDGTDPLGYDTHLRASGLTPGDYHNAQAWLEATVNSRFPDLPMQMMEMFDSRRTGDIVIFAAPGWIYNPDSIAGHGSVTPTDMLVPMVFAGPDIKPGSTLETARTIDIAPTIIEMIDAEKLKFYHFDGQSLMEQLTK
ncbi:MAG: alkaline phosphatase family protein [Sedimentisphaerales bacterium]|nr:alkaline phosphatase family protein [Sedimentisphaerales bacterium]